MNNWFWVCDINKLPTLWEKWKKKNAASIGWPPNYVKGKPDQRRKLEFNLRQVERMETGDRIVAYLKDHRVGGIGAFQKGIDPKKWTPLTEEDHGRLASVKWDTLPDEEHYVYAPEGTTPPRMPTVRRIVKPGVFEEIERAIDDRRRWGILPDTDMWVESEREDLHPLIVNSLSKLEPGLETNPWGPLREYPAFPIGKIDILCKDKEGGAVVIEVKTRAADDCSVGQIARYMTWVRTSIKGPKKVRGFLVAGEIPPMARYAAALVENLELFRYTKRGRKVSYLRVPTEPQ